jgi:amidase
MLESMSSAICDLSAVEMARLIRAGDLSARETIGAHLERIESVNPKVNAIITLTAEKAMEAAARADEAQARGEAMGCLHGLPVAHKDLQPTRDVRTTFGSPLFSDFIPTEDSLLVERVRDEGGIMMGKTNTPEFGAGSQTYNEVFGATLNPWDMTKTCGGSSGGSAVALACGMTALADGSDLGGSLRNPASFCGVVGLRPSAGRVPVRPVPTPSSPLSVEGPLARSVEDLALFLSAIAEPGSLFAAPLERDFQGVRVAWWRDLGGIPMDREVREVTNAQRSVFESLGCVVEEAEPDWEGVDKAFRTLRFWMSGLRLGDVAKQYPELLKDTLRWEIEQARGLSATDVRLAQMKHTEIVERMRRFMERYEFFVLPVSQVPPFDVTQHWPVQIGNTKMETYIDWMKSCYYVSMTASPAMSVPCGFTRAGLPVGTQIVGRHRDDFGLLQMAHAFEEAVGISERVRW